MRYGRGYRRRVYPQRRRGRRAYRGYYKRRAWRRRTFTRSNVSASRAAGFAQEHWCTIKYGDGPLNLLATSGIMGQYLFNPNDCNDPDASGGGHQPLGYDQLTAVYNNWQVSSCKYVFETQSSTSDTAPYEISTGAFDYTPATLLYSELLEQPNVKTKVVNNGQNGRMSGKISMAKLFGMTRTQYRNDETYFGSVSAGPTNEAWLTFAANNLSGTTTTVKFNIRLWFRVRFFNPKNLTTS